jgi:hypothetical protein
MDPGSFGASADTQTVLSVDTDPLIMPENALKDLQALKTLSGHSRE